MNKAYIETAKTVVETLKNDKDVTDVLEDVKGMITDLTSGKSEKVVKKLTGYADVDETLSLVQAGQEMRQRWARRNKAVNLLERLVKIAVHYAPVIKKAVKKK